MNDDAMKYAGFVYSAYNDNPKEIKEIIDNLDELIYKLGDSDNSIKYCIDREYQNWNVYRVVNDGRNDIALFEVKTMNGEHIRIPHLTYYPSLGRLEIYNVCNGDTNNELISGAITDTLLESNKDCAKVIKLISDRIKM